MPVNPIREGFHTVTPYLFGDHTAELIDFVCNAFGGEVRAREIRPDGSIMHAEVRIGDSMIMLADPTGAIGPMPTSIYLYVEDCDRVYRQALEEGAESIFDIMNLPSGERYGGVKDGSGNIWWIATHVEDLTPEEQAARWRDFRI